MSITLKIGLNNLPVSQFTLNSLHSISYILNDDKISSKINKYHPNCDYLNNISYSCFGHLRGFKHVIPSFDVDDMLAWGTDDSFALPLHGSQPKGSEAAEIRKKQTKKDSL